MNEKQSILHVFKDLSVSFGIALLLLFVFSTAMSLISPMPQHTAIVCEYNNKSCKEWNVIKEEYGRELKQLKESAGSSLLRPEVQQKVDELKAQIEEIENNLRIARNETFERTTKKSMTIRAYLGMIIGSILFIVGFLISVLPVQIGLIAGGIFIVIYGFIFSLFVMNDWIKLLFLLMALIVIITIGLKSSKRGA